jgi:hypothetical protein
VVVGTAVSTGAGVLTGPQATGNRTRNRAAIWILISRSSYLVL